MTTTTSQIAIDATQLAWTRLRQDLSADTQRQREESRRRLRGSLPLPLGFLFGTVAGAAGFALTGYPALAVPVVVVGALTLWAARRATGDATRGPC